MENQIAKLDLDFDMSSNENLCVLAHCSDRTSTQCIAMDTQSVFSFIAPVGAAQSYRNSAERPVPTANAITLRPATPLYDSLIEDLENAVKQHPGGHRFIDYLTTSCFFGNLLTMDEFGKPLESAMPLAVKMERLLDLAQHQRDRHIDRLRGASRGEMQIDTNMHFGKEDMRKIFNTWRAQPEEWMHGDTLEKYYRMLYWGQNQTAHQLAKSVFNTFLFQQSGCKFLLHKLIELPIISQIHSNSVGRPVATLLMELLDSYEEHKTTREYKTVVQRSQKHQKIQKRLSCEIWSAHYRYKKGRTLSIQVQDKSLNFHDLDSEEQKLVEDFDSRRSARALDLLLEQKRPPYRGAGIEVQHE